MSVDLTKARKAAEDLYAADPAPEYLKVLQDAGKAEMDAYLAGFDERHPVKRYVADYNETNQCWGTYDRHENRFVGQTSTQAGARVQARKMNQRDA